MKRVFAGTLILCLQKRELFSNAFLFGSKSNDPQARKLLKSSSSRPPSVPVGVIDEAAARNFNASVRLLDSAVVHNNQKKIQQNELSKSTPQNQQLSSDEGKGILSIQRPKWRRRRRLRRSMKRRKVIQARDLKTKSKDSIEQQEATPGPWHRFRIRRRRRPVVNDIESKAVLPDTVGAATADEPRKDQKRKRQREKRRSNNKQREERSMTKSKSETIHATTKQSEKGGAPAKLLTDQLLMPSSAKEKPPPRRDDGKLGQQQHQLPGGQSRNGKRVTISARHKSTRKLIDLDPIRSALLEQYMTQPVEKYSVKSFHEDNVAATSRRWLVRRLSEEECRGYTDLTKELHEGEADPGAKRPTRVDNFFRLAVALEPLIGLDVTPIIDLEVIAADKPLDTVNGETSSQDESRLEAGEETPGRFRKVLRRIRMQKPEDDPEAIQIRSLRVSLLSTEEEVRTIMGKKQSPPPTSASQNQSVRQFGYEAFNLAGKIEEYLRPHMSFEATISWSCGGEPAEEGDDKKERGKGSNDCTVTVESTVDTSLTIPPLPAAVPVPSAFLVKRIGSMITQRVLSIALPRFLAQLERDFERWAGSEEQTNGTNVQTAGTRLK